MCKRKVFQKLSKLFLVLYISDWIDICNEIQNVDMFLQDLLKNWTIKRLKIT